MGERGPTGVSIGCHRRIGELPRARAPVRSLDVRGVTSFRD
jgi:hypothetical protein